MHPVNWTRTINLPSSTIAVCPVGVGVVGAPTGLAGAQMKVAVEMVGGVMTRKREINHPQKRLVKGLLPSFLNCWIL